MKYRSVMKKDASGEKFIHIDVIDDWASFSVQLPIEFVGYGIPEESRQKIFTKIVDHMMTFNSDNETTTGVSDEDLNEAFKDFKAVVAKHAGKVVGKFL